MGCHISLILIHVCDAAEEDVACMYGTDDEFDDYIIVMSVSLSDEKVPFIILDGLIVSVLGFETEHIIMQ